MNVGAKKTNYFLPLLIIAAGLALRLWGLAASDLQGDAAINSFRALGWYDYFLTDVGQSSPLSWFGYFPWWSLLSFHDHPPLMFALQHLFFIMFGNATIVALIPHLLAYIATAFLLYEGTRRLSSRRTALITLSVFSLASYSVWATRTGYLEGVAFFFVTAAFFSLAFYFERRQPKYLYLWAIMIGLGLLSKYTTIFIPAAGVVMLTFWDRAAFRSKHFWFGTLLVLTLLTPVIIYNAMTFATRGHFDASLSVMVGMHPVDFSALSSGSGGLSLANLLSVLVVLAQSFSLPVFLVFIASLILLSRRTIFRPDRLTGNIAVTLVMGILLFSAAGASARFVTILLPFMALAVAIAADDLLTRTNGQPKRQLMRTVAIGVILFELFYAINTNVLTRPVGASPWLYSPYRFYDRGFQKLDDFLRKEVLTDLPRLPDRAQYGVADFKSAPTVIVDDRADWFALMWYFRRYLYYRVPVITITDLYRISSESESNALEFLYKQGARQFWFVHMLPDGVRRNADESYTSKVELFAQQLKDAGVKPQTITDYRGEPVIELSKFEYK